MKIVIVGAGLAGTRLARSLVQEKHDVSLIESNEERARHASNRLDCLVLHDEGNSLKALEEAGIAKAHALVCVTESDEVNMIICGLAASRYPALTKIARVRNDEYIKLNPNARGTDDIKSTAVLGIDFFVHPDVEAARAVLSALSHGASGNILGISGTDFVLGSVNVTEHSAFDNFPLKNFRSLVQEDCLITLVERGEENFLPTGDTTLNHGDRIHIMAREGNIEHLFSLAGRTEKALRRIGIVGGGRIASLIAEGLLETAPEGNKKNTVVSFFKSLIPRSRRQVIIIEQNYAVCKDLSARFPGALVLNEDITDESFVAEEQMGDLDLIITATASQELNIVAALYLKSRGVRRAIALVSGSGYETIARHLGVDVVIPMNSVVVDSIYSHLMGKGIWGIHSLGERENIIEAEIAPDSPIVEKGITEFKLSAGGLILLVHRGENSFIPRGDYVFKEKDKVIFIAKNGSEDEIEKFFGIPG